VTVPVSVQVPVSVTVQVTVPVSVSVSVPVQVSVTVPVSVPVSVTVSVSVQVTVPVPVSVQVPVSVTVPVSVSVTVNKLVGLNFALIGRKIRMNYFTKEELEEIKYFLLGNPKSTTALCYKLQSLIDNYDCKHERTMTDTYLKCQDCNKVLDYDE